MVNMVTGILLFLIIKVDAESISVNPDIYVHPELNAENKCTVVGNQTLCIILNYYNAILAWCQATYSTAPFQNFTETATYKYNGRIISALTVPNITDAMSTIWSCVILEDFRAGIPYRLLNRNYTSFVVNINLHVKGAKAVNLFVNDINLKIVRSSLRFAFDGHVNYTYLDGEAVDYFCRKNNAALRLKYYNSQGILLFETKEIKNAVNFLSTMTSNDSYSYIDCIYTTLEPKDEYNYRTTFILKHDGEDASTIQDDIIVSVNDMKLIPKSSDTKRNHIKYTYTFTGGDILKVSCEKNRKFNDRLKFTYNQTLNLIVTEDSSEKISILINTNLTYIKNNTITCSFFDSDLYFDVLFLRDESIWHKPKLIGLPAKNVLYQYTHAENQLTVAYEYTVNETLYLKCVKNGVQVQNLTWKFENRNINPHIDVNLFALRYNINSNFTLGEQHNGTTIQCINNCEHYVKIVEVILHLKPLEINDSHINISEIANPTEKNNLLMILGLPFVSVVIIITMVCIVCWYTKSKNVVAIENSYENLTNQNEPIPTFPSQWENIYSIIEEDCMFHHPSTDTAEFVPPNECYRRSNMASESHYTEIGDYFKVNKNDGITAGNTVKANSNVNLDDTDLSYTNGNLSAKMNSSANLVEGRPNLNGVVDPVSSNSILGNVSRDGNKNKYENVNPNLVYAQPYEHRAIIIKVRNNGNTLENINSLDTPCRVPTEVNCENELYDKCA